MRGKSRGGSRETRRMGEGVSLKRATFQTLSRGA